MEHFTRISPRAGKLPDGSQPERGWKKQTNQPTNKTIGLHGTSWLSTQVATSLVWISYTWAFGALGQFGHIRKSTGFRVKRRSTYPWLCNQSVWVRLRVCHLNFCSPQLPRVQVGVRFMLGVPEWHKVGQRALGCLKLYTNVRDLHYGRARGFPSFSGRGRKVGKVPAYFICKKGLESTDFTLTRQNTIV